MYVKLIDSMGSDLSVVNAARVSFNQQSSELTEKDKKLIEYLARGFPSEEYTEKLALAKEIAACSDDEEAKSALIAFLGLEKRIASHWTPFAHTAITLEVYAPLPVRVHCFKHKIGLVENEQSRRYRTDKLDFYIPQFRERAEHLKQGSKDSLHPKNEELQQQYAHVLGKSLKFYEMLIAEGVAPEQARFILPQALYTKWLWTGNLVSFANFVNTRSDSHAQKETRDLALLVSEVITPLFPYSWFALTGFKPEELKEFNSLNQEEKSSKDSPSKDSSASLSDFVPAEFKVSASIRSLMVTEKISVPRTREEIVSTLVLLGSLVKKKSKKQKLYSLLEQWWQEKLSYLELQQEKQLLQKNAESLEKNVKSVVDGYASELTVKGH